MSKAGDRRRPDGRSMPPPARSGRVRRVALTGGIATGKSHVRAGLERLGVPAIDTDVLAREAVMPGTAGLSAVVARFGPDVLEPTGELNRRALGARVFGDAAARRDLEAIVHPHVRRTMNQWFDTLDARAYPFAVAEIPLLFETGLDRDFDTVIVVACSPAEQIRRITARDRLTETEARQRLDAQLPIDEKTRRADFVIRTDGSRAETDQQVQALYARLVKMP